MNVWTDRWMADGRWVIIGWMADGPTLPQRASCVSPAVQHWQRGRGKADLPPVLPGEGSGSLCSRVYHSVSDHGCGSQPYAPQKTRWGSVCTRTFHKSCGVFQNSHVLDELQHHLKVTSPSVAVPQMWWPPTVWISRSSQLCTSFRTCTPPTKATSRSLSGDTSMGEGSSHPSRSFWVT